MNYSEPLPIESPPGIKIMDAMMDRQDESIAENEQDSWCAAHYWLGQSQRLLWLQACSRDTPYDLYEFAVPVSD